MIAAISATAELVLAANARLTTGRAPSCGERNAARTAAAPLLDAALASAAAQRSTDLGDAQPCRLTRAWRRRQHAQRVAVRELGEGLQCAREVLAQRAAQPVGLADAVPDQLLVRPGEDAHRARVVAVAGDRAVVVAVGADEVGEQLGVAASDFAPLRWWRSR